MFQNDLLTLEELKKLTEDYSIPELEDAIFLDNYKFTGNWLRIKIELLLRTHGVINVINSFEMLKNIKKGH